MMTDWCSKISLFSWLSGDSTDRANHQPSHQASTNHASSKSNDRPAEATESYPNETTKRTKSPQQRDTPSRSFNQYSKNENTIYFHKASGTNFDAKVVGVHFDDDPENPYYTIQYTARDGEQVERQTTEDRLLPVE
jgi:hypothetical protein